MTLTAKESKMGIAARKADKGKQGRPLAYYEREFVIHLGVLGNTRRQVCEKFEKRYGRTLNYRTVTRIWSENRAQMDEAQNSLATQGMQLISGDALKQKSYDILDRRLTRAQADESEVEKLRLKYRAGEISKAEFDREVGRYDQLSINELVKIADMGFEHNHKGNEGPALTAEDQAALGLLTEGLKTGNPFQLIQVLNPSVTKVYPNGENPVPPADML